MLLPLRISLLLALALLVVAVMGSELWRGKLSQFRRLWLLVHMMVEPLICFCFGRDLLACCVFLVVGRLSTYECCLVAVGLRNQNSRDRVVVVAISPRGLFDKLPVEEWELVEYCRNL